MGQNQLNNNQNIETHPELKPPEIIHLEKSIDEGKFFKPDSPSLMNYQLLLKSSQTLNFVYGLKLILTDPKKQLVPNPQLINFPVKIFLLNNQTQTKKDSLVFEGQLFRGKRHSFGVQYDLNGSIFYQGEFKNNKYHGWGVTSQYEGEWAYGAKHGYGKYQKKGEKNNFFYQGGWRDDKFDGLGAVNVSLSESKEFIREDYEGNQDKIDYQYVGEWFEGCKFGFGKIIKYKQKGWTVDKEVYEGEFSKNLYHGHGKLKSGRGEWKQGIFEAGKFVRNTEPIS